MSHAGGTGVPPPFAPRGPQQVPKGGQKGPPDPFHMGIGALLSLLAHTLWGFTAVLTEYLSTLNQEMEHEALQLSIVGQKIAEAKCDHCKAALKAQQQDLESQISMINVATTAATSADSSLTTRSGFVVKTAGEMALSIAQNM